MKRSIGAWLRNIGLVAVGLVLLIVAFGAIILATETGTRWALQKAISFSPGQIDVPEIHGTLLSELDVPLLRYSDPAFQAVANDLIFSIDWTSSSLQRIALRRLSADDISYQSLAETDPSPQPLEVSMPALPIQLGASDVVVRSLRLNELSFANIGATDLQLEGNRISVATATAEVADVVVSVNSLTTKLDGDVPIAGDVIWRTNEGQWSGEGRFSGSLAELSFEHELSGEFPASSNGKAFLLNKVEPELDADIRFASWQFESLNATAGEVHVAGTVTAYRTNFSVDVNDAQSLSATVSGVAEGDRYGFDSLDVVVDGPAGQLSVTGRLGWLPTTSTDISITGRSLDPSVVFPTVAGKLDTELRLIATSATEFALEIKSLLGTYNNERVQASGRVSRSNGQWNCVGCDAVLGPNKLAVEGTFGDDKVSAEYRINAPVLAMLWPGLAGALSADGNVRGTVNLPILSGSVAGQGLVWADYKVESLSLQSRASSIEKVDFDLNILGLTRKEMLLGSGTARVSGEINALDSDFEWSFADLDGTAHANITVNGNAISGLIHSASLAEPFTGTWELSGPLQFSASAEEVRASEHAWANGEAELQVTHLAILNGEVESDAMLRNAPLATFNNVMPENIRVEGYADAEWSLRQQTDGWLGDIRWNQRNTLIRVESPGDEPIEIALPVVDADVRLIGGGAEGRATIDVDPGVSALLEVSVAEFSADSAMTARLKFGGNQWDWIPALIPEIDNFEGVISSDISASGKLGAPELQGELRWQGGKLDVPSLNIPLTSIELTVTGSSAGSAIVAGSAVAGNGTINVDGRFDDLTQRSRSFNVRLRGEQATLLNWTDYHLDATPDLVVTGGQDDIAISGKIDIDKAEITVKEIPEGAVSPSVDVTVTGREPEPVVNIPVQVDVQVMATKDVHIIAFGLDTNLEGQLRFRIPDNRPPRADGELKLIDGVFQAYGQRLTIQQGTMTFTGPIDDPIISIRAVREIEGLSGTITAGIELRGRAQNLASTVFSTPTMSEAEALSYLVFGRPLDQASTSEGNALSGAAYALGLRQATAITNQIGRTLGLDQLALTGNNQSTTALVAGKQINSRLYARYAYSAFTQLGNLLLRYRLSKNFTIEAGTGELQMMDLLYIVEKP